MTEDKAENAPSTPDARGPRPASGQQGYQGGQQGYQGGQQGYQGGQQGGYQQGGHGHQGKGGRPVSPVPTVDPAVAPIDLSRLKHVKVPELHAQAIAAGVDVTGNLRRQDIIFEILKWLTDNNGAIQGGGVMEYNSDSYGFLREPAYNYEASADDIYVAPSIVRAFGLRTGDTIAGYVRVT